MAVCSVCHAAYNSPSGMLRYCSRCTLRWKEQYAAAETTAQAHEARGEHDAARKIRRAVELMTQYRRVMEFGGDGPAFSDDLTPEDHDLLFANNASERNSRGYFSTPIIEGSRHIL